jgi:hypothetical protein
MTVLVTGCIRSGTAYTTQVLRNLGLDVVHEGSGKDGSVSAFLGKPGVKLPPWHGLELPRYDIILHQVRHPVPVVASMRPSSDHFWTFARDYAGVDGKTVLLRSMQYWDRWNRIVEARAQATYRIEHAPWPELCAVLGITYDAKKIAAVSKQTNSRQNHPHYRRLFWTDLEAADVDLCVRIRELATHYGYD